MPIVSISEAARLTGKSRQTLHRHIVTGKISKCNTEKNEIGIDISELLRVYGSIKSYNVTGVKNKKILQHTTGDITHTVTKEFQENNKIQQLEKELAVLKVKVDEQEKRIEAKQETIDTLKSALKLLEHKQTRDEFSQTAPIPPKSEQSIPEPPETISIDIASDATNPASPPPSGFWGSFKKLFQ